MASGQTNSASLNRSARNISVAIRKVVLDRGGYLFKKCVEPRLHPLKYPKTGRREGLRPDVLVERIEGMSISYTEGESDKEKTFNAPAYEHRTVVKPLYGLHRTGKERYQLDDPFDLPAQPMKYGRWLNLKVLQVGEEVLSAERILQLLANYEGAHIDSNEMTRFNTSAPVDIKLTDRKDELYQKGHLDHVWWRFVPPYLFAPRWCLSGENDEGDFEALFRGDQQAISYLSSIGVDIAITVASRVSYIAAGKGLQYGRVTSKHRRCGQPIRTGWRLWKTRHYDDSDSGVAVTGVNATAGGTFSKSSKVATTAVSKRTVAKQVPLTGSNPQIAKGDGDTPVPRYIAAMPRSKRDIGHRRKAEDFI